VLLGDDVINDIIKAVSPIREEHIDTRTTNIVLNIIQFRQELLEKKHFKEKSWRHHYDVIRSRDVIGIMCNR